MSSFGIRMEVDNALEEVQASQRALWQQLAENENVMCGLMEQKIKTLQNHVRQQNERLDHIYAEMQEPHEVTCINVFLRYMPDLLPQCMQIMSDVKCVNESASKENVPIIVGEMIQGIRGFLDERVEQRIMAPIDGRYVDPYLADWHLNESGHK
jgi:hypothetical protein